MYRRLPNQKYPENVHIILIVRFGCPPQKPPNISFFFHVSSKKYDVSKLLILRTTVSECSPSRHLKSIMQDCMEVPSSSKKCKRLGNPHSEATLILCHSDDSLCMSSCSSCSSLEKLDHEAYYVKQRR